MADLTQSLLNPGNHPLKHETTHLNTESQMKSLSLVIVVTVVCLLSVAVAQEGRVIAIDGVPVAKEMCQEEKAAWDAAESALDVAIVERSAAKDAQVSAAASLEAAQAALTAAQADLEAANATYAETAIVVNGASTEATAAYKAYVDCRVGK